MHHPLEDDGRVGEAVASLGGEEAGAVSKAEERFERWRQTIGLFAGPAAFAIVWALPFATMSAQAHRLAAVVSLVVVWWVSEAIPIPATALVGSALTVLMGIASAQDAYAPFASPTIFLFMGSFMIGRAASEHGLDRRLAVSVLSIGAVRGNVARIRLAMAGLCLVVSAWMSNTATTAMMLPVALGVLTATRATRGPDRRYASGFMLMVAYAASIGGLMTPVGSPPNLITLGLLERTVGIRINFFSWMLVMIPIALAMAAAMFALDRFWFPPPGEARTLPASYVRHQQTNDPWTRGQRNCAIAFLTAVVLWITPGVVALAGYDQTPVGRLLAARLDEAVVAVIAASLLFLLPTDWGTRRFTLGWRAASQIDWGTILLFGGGLSLGRLMFTTGLAEHVGRALVAASGAESLWAVTAISVAVGIALTEITSNTAATNMLVPVVLSICQVERLNPVAPALGACVGASMAFMLPISTPPNAIVYGTGLVPITTMIRFGVAMDIVAFFIVLGGLRLLCPLL